MYINYIPITVTKGVGDNSLYNKLLNIIVTNLKIPQLICKILETFIYLYPNLGSNVEIILVNGPFTLIYSTASGTFTTSTVLNLVILLNLGIPALLTNILTPVIPTITVLF